MKNLGIPYTWNGIPRFFTLDEMDVEAKAVTLYFDAAFTTNDLAISWSTDYNPEKLSILITASLEDSAVRKIPELPKTSKFTFEFPSQEEFVEGDICIDVDLSLGK